MTTLACRSPSLPKSSIQSQKTSLSLEVASCQEDSKNDKEKNIKKDQDQEPSMSSNPFHDVSYFFHDPFDPPSPSSFIPQGLTSSPKQDQATTYTLELIDNENNLTTLALSKDDTSIKVIENGVVTSNFEPIKNQEKSSMLIFFKDPCQDKSLPSSCSTTPCSLPLSTLPKSSQASSAPMKEISPIQNAHYPIKNPNSHSKGVDVFGCHKYKQKCSVPFDFCILHHLF